jgi:putative FmdB family regulatory protein
MPLYEYQCDACAHRFEVIQKYSDAPIDVCPKCGGAVSKLLSSPAIQFKGSGWYITDYARSGKSEAGNVSSGRNETGGSGSSGGSGSETKSEAKTETKSEAKTESAAASASPAKSD